MKTLTELIKKGIIRAQILGEIRDERDRQNGADHPSFSDKPYLITSEDNARAFREKRTEDGTLSLADILLEKVAGCFDLRHEGKVRGENEEELRAGLVQVAATVMSWIEAIDKKRTET